MGTEKLEREKAPSEGKKPTPKAEGKEPTQGKVEPTPKTYTQQQYDSAVGKGLSSLQQQLSQQKAETGKAQEEAENLKTLQRDLETERQTLQGEVERLIGEHDPEALKGYKDTKAIKARERALDLKEKELKNVETQQEGLRSAIVLNNKANELQEKYQVPRDVLESCSTEEQMETIARAFPEKGESKEDTTKTETKDPKFDSGLGDGGGKELADMAPKDRMKEADKQLRAK